MTPIPAKVLSVEKLRTQYRILVQIELDRYVGPFYTLRFGESKPFGGACHYGQVELFIYGVFAVLFLPGAYLYSHGGSDRRETAVLAGACWIVAIAYFRGIATG